MARKAAAPPARMDRAAAIRPLTIGALASADFLNGRVDEVRINALGVRFPRDQAMVMVDTGWAGCGVRVTATCPAGKRVVYGLKFHNASNNAGYSGGAPACDGAAAIGANIDVCPAGGTSCSNNNSPDTNWTGRVVILCN